MRIVRTVQFMLHCACFSCVRGLCDQCFCISQKAWNQVIPMKSLVSTIQFNNTIENTVNLEILCEKIV